VLFGATVRGQVAEELCVKESLFYKYQKLIESLRNKIQIKKATHLTESSLGYCQQREEENTREEG
jgi:hypothetical protein